MHLNAAGLLELAIVDDSGKKVGAYQKAIVVFGRECISGLKWKDMKKPIATSFGQY